MIHVDRSRVPSPEVLDAPAAVREREEAKAFFTGRNRARQLRFEFKVFHHQEVVSALRALFQDKCAYCEVRIEPSARLDVEMFRPKNSVAERPEHPGYWWLTSVWDNLLASCPKCNRAGEKSGKANRFPLVHEADRAFHPGDEVREEPLLLDPCRDQPEEHLVFDQGGKVVGDTKRGQTTITVIGLNRADLVQARRRAAESVLDKARLLEQLVKAPAKRSGPDGRIAVLTSALRAELSDEAEFAGMKRQVLRPYLDRLAKAGLTQLRPAAESLPKVTKERKANAQRVWGEYVTEQSSYSLADAKGRETFKSQRRLIERVVIHNVKAIRDLDLDFTATGEGLTPWRMFLGENGTGKSTVLQVIALTLIGAGAFARLGNMGAVLPSDFIRNRCKSGWVKVCLSGFTRPHTLTFHEDHVLFEGPTEDQRAVVRFKANGTAIEGHGWQPQTIVLGYGATRLLPRSTAREVTSVGDDYSRVDNLFDPFVPLRDADDWMRGLSELEFDSASLVLKDLLSLAPSARFEIRDDRVEVLQHGAWIPLRRLSDGYQSVIATAADILEVLTRLWPNLQDAEGIVILDEIGAHLHPTWKMQIVTSIRRAAPAVQFVVSTHDPLCLRGLGAGEVVVMQRDTDDQVVALTDLPSPADFRIDQLLTSSFFGLNSTSDPETDRDFTVYYSLLATPDLSDAQTAELARLTEKLKERDLLGSTPREQLMYKAVDHIVAAERREPTARRMSDLAPDAIARVAAIWARPAPQEETQ